jgi:hypothetical protein
MMIAACLTSNFDLHPRWIDEAEGYVLTEQRKMEEDMRK